MQAGLHSTDKDLTKLESGDDDEHLAQQNQEQLADYKSQLDALHDQLAGLAIEEDDDLLSTHAALEEL